MKTTKKVSKETIKWVIKGYVFNSIRIYISALKGIKRVLDTWFGGWWQRSSEITGFKSLDILELKIGFQGIRREINLSSKRNKGQRAFKSSKKISTVRKRVLILRKSLNILKGTLTWRKSIAARTYPHFQDNRIDRNKLLNTNSSI